MAGVAVGLFLLVRGLRAYRAGEPVRGTGTSRIESLAAGEVRLVGTIEAGPVALVSPLQSVPCVYYRARILEDRGQDRARILDEERAVGFRLRDDTGSLRVFPRGARWDAPMRFRDQSDWSGEDPPGLNLNAGPAVTSATLDREAAVAALLTVHGAVGGSADAPDGLLDGGALAALAASGGEGNVIAGIGGGPFGVAKGRRHYEERRLAPGDIVTIVGSAIPFHDIDDPATADRDEPMLALDDPEVARNIAEARAAGLLKASADEAWGNAAIPGFGIGHPTRAPELDPAALPLQTASADEATAAAAAFDIAPGELVMAASPDNPLDIRVGIPGEAAARDQGALTQGLVGAVLAIAAGIVLALAVQGGGW